ncbi:inorganic phosphate transporter [Sutterella sp.]|uniref:inorganic phosphate transporter n=1 Tax=Sutterella sp. TaxID=1981025 RepID=UPI0026E0D831|nr:inorganic phosphate transporter [Sutterella sp.]MDO5532683.1 inorganic phosphate transporter [Sutterella sp.]
MEHYYLVMLAFLGVIAIIDLFVGVSNDASNFLQSALGCRIASFRTTMWVAAAGVLLGSTFSSGMMEIARSGVFNPQMFTFAEIMVIFFAVMVADIILLDTFNSLGLPTSTTVSIVFELLGSAIAAAAMKLLSEGASLAEVAEYINSSKALTIISGILISVVVAFVAGTVVQYVARLIFSFRWEGAYRKVGAVYAGLAITSIIYFLVMKGAKGASFMRPEWIEWIDANTQVILISLFVGLSVFFQICISFFKANVFKVIILAGTFSLAFAFAGNDLVNFVGVPLAALDSWEAWKASGIEDEAFMMGGLLEPSTAPTIFLLLSGLVMVLTLWFSKKAHRVIQTSINLASQASEQEQFGASLPGRLIVRGSMTAGRIINQIMPGAVKRGLESRFEPLPSNPNEAPLPFDYVRASINLVVSAILIASATSLKLPLSTTYVTFMVAMGSSFADGAWDRETAVYRISGVLTVISGWFVTAFCASSLAALVAVLVFWGGEIMAVLLGVVSIGLLVRSNIKADAEDFTMVRRTSKTYNAQEIRAMINEKAPDNLRRTVEVVHEVLDGLLSDRERTLGAAKVSATELFDDLSAQRSVYYSMAMLSRSTGERDFDARYCYLRAFTSMREVGRTLQNLAKLSRDHVANRHRVYEGRLADDLKALLAMLDNISLNAEGKPDLKTLAKNAPKALEAIEDLHGDLLRSIPSEGLSVRGAELYLSFLLFARQLITYYQIVSMIEGRVAALCSEAEQATEKSAEPAQPQQPAAGQSA